MPKMKFSGYEYIGNIPINWNLKKIKYVYNIQTGFTPDTSRDDYYSENSKNTWVSIADLTNNVGKEIIDSSNYISDIYLREKKPKRIKKGSLLYSFKLSVGKTAFAGKDLYTNEAIASFESNNEVCLDYLNYASFLIEQNANKNIYNAFILNQELIKNSITIVPPIEEQRLIADFLDEKVDTIDNIICDLNYQIEVLNNYKDSLILESVSKGLIEHTYKNNNNKWFSIIPANWQFIALKRVTDILTCGYASTPDYVDEKEGILFLSAQNIQNGKIDLSIKKYIPKELHKSLVRNKHAKVGDILQVRVGATIGKTAIVNINEDFSYYVSLTHIRANKLINNRYLNYILSTDTFKQMVSLDVDFAGTQGNLNVSDLREAKIPLPPIDEQIKIADYLDKKCSEIDEILNSKIKQKEQMEQYKKSVIYEYVTGKKRVEGAEELYG